MLWTLPSQSAKLTTPECTLPKPSSPPSALFNAHLVQNGLRQPSCIVVLVKSPLNACPASETYLPTSPANTVWLVPSVIFLNDTLGLKPNIRLVAVPSHVMSK